MTVYEDSGFNIIEEGGALPEKAQDFKNWYEENMGYAHIDPELNAVLIPPFDYNVDEDEFLHVDLDKAYMVWKGAKESQ
ncbi:hypothetical protein [Acinetobacter sp. 'aerobic (ED)']|uniref:hypothetical protein n=1 Tax=Acinetobacter sp. 'aerobic (ED)' TaxID=174230 RepID=UPI00192ABB6A|nr:hypothetical protein [Acinetobacter sp. 'aerobic (ED)']